MRRGTTKGTSDNNEHLYSSSAFPWHCVVHQRLESLWAHLVCPVDWFRCTLVSVTVWPSLGAVFLMFASLSLNLLKVNVGMDLWRKVNIVLALGVVYKPALGIPI
jgi:hypothetical protein